MSSNDLAISVHGLGKRYFAPQRNRLHHGRLSRMRASLREFFPVFGETSEQDYFWALKDVSFDVPKGQILGILGRNGSGKSTLLKLLTGVTPPTEGRAMLRGRVGSLLEVGTGFHPDLSGRDNVFVSGALLGLSRREIRQKFDDIVDFSGIADFIDVPVKRYSSGMYVRLAYSVASLLKSDILILDEVLAVGDTAFREKSEKNIQNAAREGRTILFVTHNVKAISAICHAAIILEKGRITYADTSQNAVQEYLRRLHGYSDDAQASAQTRWDLEDKERLGDADRKVLRWISLHKPDGTPANTFSTGEGCLLRIGFKGMSAPLPYFSILVHNDYVERVATLHSTHQGEPLPSRPDGVIECRIPELRLGEGKYRIMIDHGNCTGHRESLVSLDCVPSAARMGVTLNGYLEGVGHDAFQGAVHKSRWTLVDGDR